MGSGAIIKGRLTLEKTRQSTKTKYEPTLYHLRSKGKVLVEGRSVGDEVGRGKVRVIKDVAYLHNLKLGEVLVTGKTDPDWQSKKAATIVTHGGGRTCHAAIDSRELG